MAQHVEKLATQRFKVWWDEAPQELLALDFSVFNQWMEPIGHYCLLHWQARPKGFRRWGLYDRVTDTYTPCDWYGLQIDAPRCRTLQVDETVIKTVPTAVLAFPGAKVLEFNPVRVGVR